MTTRMLSDLIGLSVLDQSGEVLLGTCIDVLIDVQAGKLVYLLVSEPDGGREIIGMISAGVTDLSGNTQLSTQLSEQSLTAWTARVQSSGDGAAVDLTQAPPIFTGPFGYTVSPALTGAVLNDALTNDPGPDRPDISDEHPHWHWFSRLAELPVFTAASDLGHVKDVTVDGKDRCIDLIVVKGDAVTRRSFDQIRHVARGETSIVIQVGDAAPWMPEDVE